MWDGLVIECDRGVTTLFIQAKLNMIFPCRCKIKVFIRDYRWGAFCLAIANSPEGMSVPGHRGQVVFETNIWCLVVWG